MPIFSRKLKYTVLEKYGHVKICGFDKSCLTGAHLTLGNMLIGDDAIGLQCNSVINYES